MGKVTAQMPHSYCKDAGMGILKKKWESQQNVYKNAAVPCLS